VLPTIIVASAKMLSKWLTADVLNIFIKQLERQLYLKFHCFFIYGAGRMFPPPNMKNQEKGVKVTTAVEFKGLKVEMLEPLRKELYPSNKRSLWLLHSTDFPKAKYKRFLSFTDILFIACKSYFYT
jgi:predicted metallo-beta-lactamase superfamily hydrolase